MALFKPRRIPTTHELKSNPIILFSNSCLDRLEIDLKKSAKVDSPLALTFKNFFLEHIGKTPEGISKTTSRYHQIWTLEESIANYNHESLSNSLLEMITDHGTDQMIGKSCSFYCQEFTHGNLHYLVAVIND